MNTTTIAAALLVLSVTGAAADCLAIKITTPAACLAEQRQAPEGCTSIKSNDARELCRSALASVICGAGGRTGFDGRR